MVCGQCGAGLTPDMLDEGACEFCGTAIADVAPHKHVERVVNERLEDAKEDLRRDLKRELKADLAEQAHQEQPSVVLEAAKEAGRTTALKVWGCGAGCLSTAGSVALTLLIFAIAVFTQIAPQIDWSKVPYIGKGHDTHKQAPHPKRHRSK